MASLKVSITRKDRFDASRLPMVASSIFGIFLLMGGLPSPSSSSASENVPFEVLDGDQCFMFSQLVATRVEGNNVIELPLELVINTEGDYRKLFDPKIMRQSCEGIPPSERIPGVDFSRKTVLGLWNSGSCAATGFERKVMKDDIRKSVTYSVSVIESEISCSGPGLESLNLISVPKIPAGYRILFEDFHK